MWFLCFLPGCELQGHSRPVLRRASASTWSKAGGPQIGAGTKALGNRGTRPPGACSLALTDRLCGPFVEVFLKQIETLPQSIG